MRYNVIVRVMEGMEKKLSPCQNIKDKKRYIGQEDGKKCRRSNECLAYRQEGDLGKINYGSAKWMEEKREGKKNEGG